MYNTAKTKIIATIGPSSWDKSVLTDMINSGLAIARINSSFANDEEITRVAKSIREISPRVALMLDTQGSKVRIVNVKDEINIQGQTIISSNRNTQGIQISYPNVHQYLKQNDLILLDDGNIELAVERIEGEEVFCKVIQSGVLKPNKTVFLPSVRLDLPIISEKDKGSIESALRNDYDFLSVSFVRTKGDIEEIKQIVGQSDIKIIAKIENQEGLDNFDEILSVADGIMIARGDLGVEIPYEKLPVLQKQLIYRCRAVGKPIIVATQMLESMRENIRPTRAEVSDVANAVMDGTDAVMLSAETSTGRYPVEAMKALQRIAKEAEAVMQTSKVYGATQASREVDELCRNACDIVENTNIKGIVVLSNMGKTLPSLCRHRPNIHIWSISNKIKRIRQERIFFGVTSYYIREFPTDRDETIERAVDIVFSHGELDLNDKIAIISGSSIRHNSEDATLEIVTVKDVLSR
ncbi:MAG TPA: pyruvate kinase [Candidatus Dojkabacteria bacterium]|nr:pyruvate kinase [Candidatus Dojkabacteria bacterium]